MIVWLVFIMVLSVNATLIIRSIFLYLASKNIKLHIEKKIVEQIQEDLNKPSLISMIINKVKGWWHRNKQEEDPMAKFLGGR